MKIPFGLIFAHTRRTWLRSLLTVGSVFLAVLLFGFLRTFLVGMETQAAASNPARLVVSSDLSLFANLPRKIESQIVTVAGIPAERITHFTWYGGVYLSDDPEHYWGRFGVDVPSFRTVYGSDMELQGEVWERWMATRTGCIVGEDLVAREGFKIGGKVPIEGNVWGGRIELEIVGIYRSKVASFDEGTLFFHWDYLNESSKAAGGRSELISTFTMLLEDPARGPSVAAAVDAHFQGSDSRTRTLTERAFSSQFNSMWGNLPLYFGVLATVALVACLMVTANTMYLNAKERVREIGILKTLGFTPTAVAAMSLVESILLCLIGGVLALLLVGSLDGKTLMFVVAAVPLSTYLEGLAITLVLALVSGIFPALAARKLPVAEALRRTA